MNEIHVECYSGHRADERPLRFSTGDRTYAVERFDDKWYSPGASNFRVLADDGNIYVLKHDEFSDTWSPRRLSLAQVANFACNHAHFHARYDLRTCLSLGTGCRLSRALRSSG